ncbi:putative E3 ubiquitin-protein ligase UBR7 [Argiope bruennichi]|uniref:Putative E3 ubiquitin-protein ligase UBR7 like protein n=1 Tax=Argiope bruennichi TaxID=94029 RepID=A0A8T0FFG4_ARGBR|nr:putative E3 ubiquitin-protein ligase UBR7 [Argiope bruennichi]KAF8788958.1 putative E3 ubiquitin-protein ligase UBR7 like protein [Argiope bruennichi]
MASASPNSNEETELTMCDVLEEEQELEEDANAVLGGSDDTNCSYDKGYVPRQALYACTTCSVNGEGGVCLACCYACHDGHEVVELYTKRNFRCDCGNSKFNGKACTLKPDKDAVNCKNKYNQNFKGLYCSCSRPYPDTEDDTPDEMIQCVMCEDWYHGRHLGVKIPEDYFEMICYNCMEAHKFLYVYLNKHEMKVDPNSSTKADVDQKKTKIENIPLKSESVANGHASKEEEFIDVIKVEESDNCSIEQEVKVDEKADSASIKEGPIVKSEAKDCDSSPELIYPSSSNDKELNHQNGTTDKGAAMQIKTECNGDSKVQCILKGINVDQSISSGTAFWPENWRNELCRCSDCMAMYEKYQCVFLLNPDDTIQAYEERGKGGSKESQYDRGLSALGRLDRVKQMEAVRAYTNMKGELKEYLKQFAENKRTVCESDIKEFFERISKKQKLSNGVPYFCR